MPRLNRRLFVVSTLGLFVVSFALLFGRGYAAPRASLPAIALGNAFQYLGRLSVANGSYDFQFRLFDAASAGNLVGSPNTVTVNDALLANAQYVVSLDFGSTAFTGDQRWLEVRYRAGSSTGAYTLQSGRQSLQPVPYALSLRPGTQMTGSVATGLAVLRANNSGTGVGLYGYSPSGIGMVGASSRGNGVQGSSALSNGVYGLTTAANTQTTAGLYGRSTGSGGTGVIGEAMTGTARGVLGKTQAGTGVAGQSTSGSGTSGQSQSWYGVYGTSASSEGVHGDSQSATHGAVVGVNSANGIGVKGTGRTGVWGESTNWQGVYGHSSSGTGVTGESQSFDGIYGVSHGQTASGVSGHNDANGFGVWGGTQGGTAVQGVATGGRGVAGFSDTWQGVYGHSNTQAGVVGESESFVGVWAESHNANNTALYAKNTAGGAAAYFEGKTSTSVLEIRGGSDLAERFDVADAASAEPGTLMVIDPVHPGKLMASTSAYDARVAGVVSGAGGVNPGLTLHQTGVLEGDHVVAIAGRVYVKADATPAPIHAGDLLTSSDIPGTVMKATDRERAAGAIIGKAMSGLDSGTGMVLVLVNLQ